MIDEEYAREEHTSSISVVYKGIAIVSAISVASSRCSLSSAIVVSTLSIVLRSAINTEKFCKKDKRKTYRPPCIIFNASAAFFIAAIVSAFMFADSNVFTCISRCNRLSPSRLSSVSCIFFRFSAAVATV